MWWDKALSCLVVLIAGSIAVALMVVAMGLPFWPALVIALVIVAVLLALVFPKPEK